MWLRSNSFQQRSRQARFADTRFAGEQYDLPFATLRLRPASQQKFEFFFSTDKLAYSVSVQSLEAALDQSWSQCSPRSYGTRDTLEIVRPKVVKLEQVAQE